MSSNSTTNSTTSVGGGVTGPPENLGPQAEIITWVFVAVTFIFLSLRLYCKWLKSRGLWWDDYLLMISWVFLLICGILLNLSVKLGFGYHVYVLAVTTPQNLAPIGFLNYLSGTFSILAAVWSKTAFAITLLRIGEARWFKGVVWFIIVTINIAMILNAIFAFVQCNPVEKVWNIYLPGSCWREIYADYGIASGVYSGIADVALALLPWKIILGLQMKLAEKLGVAIAMSMGIFAGVTAFIKSSQIPALAKGDFTYDGYGLVVWGSCEVAMTIIAACIPVLRVLVRDVQAATRRRVYGSSSASRSRGNGGTHLGKSHNGTVADNHNATIVSTSGGKSGGGGRGAAVSGTEVHGDDWSERSIFHGSDGNGKIRATHEVKVEYHARDDNASDSNSDHPRRDEYELGRVGRSPV